MSEEERQYNGNNNKMNDRRYRKIFVGGLAWETQRDSMKKYFEEFGEILEAVVITDKTSGRSKGYGFVTFKEEEAAKRACLNPSPLIDGRRTNCNIAYFGLNNNTPQYVGGKFRSAGAGLMGTPPTYHTPPYFHHQPYYGYTGYSHDNMYNMKYYGGFGEEEAGGSSGGRIGYFQNIYSYNYINPYSQTNHVHAYCYGFQYPQPHPHPHPHHMIQLQQYPFYPQHFTPFSTPILTHSPTLHFRISTTITMPTTTTSTTSTMPTTTITTGWKPSVGALASTGSAGATKTGTGSTCEHNAATNKTVTGSSSEQNAAT